MVRFPCSFAGSLFLTCILCSPINTVTEGFIPHLLSQNMYAGLNFKRLCWTTL